MQVLSRDRIIFLSILFIGLILRLSNFGFITHNDIGHLNFIDTDCYYQLRRLVYFLSNFPKVLQFDHLADWPSGSWVDWPEGFSILVGTILKIFGIQTFRGLEWGASIIMILFGLSAIYFVHRTAARIIKSSHYVFLCSFFAATNFLLIRFSCLGQVDHHILEAIFPLLFLLVAFQISSSKSKIPFVLLGILIFFSLSVSTSSVFSIGAFFFSFGIIFGRRQNYLNLLLLSILPACVLITLYAWWYHSIRGLWISIDHPSLFHLSVVILLALFSLVLVEIRESQSRWKWSLSVGLLCLLSVGYLFNFPRFFFVPLTNAWIYAFGKAGILSNVSEASSIWTDFGEFQMNFAFANFGYLVFLIPAIWLILPFLFLSSKSFRFEERLFLFFLGLISIPGVTQKRFSHLMVGLVLIFYVWLLIRATEWLGRARLRVVPMTHALFVGMLVFPLISVGFAPGSTPRDRIDHAIVAEFLKVRPQDEVKIWKRLAMSDRLEISNSLKEDYLGGLWANPNLGHMFEYMAALPVVTNSFYHRRGLELDFKLRSIASSDSLLEELKLQDIRFLVLADDFRYFELQYRLRNLSTSRWYREEQTLDRTRTIFVIPELQKFAWVRLLTEEKLDARVKKLFSLRATEDYYYTFIRAFEL